VYELTVLRNPWIPADVKNKITPKQAEFLVYEGREALFGGAAGGGKSVALLLAALQYVEEPGYAALILRRTYTQLAKADSILAKAKEWLIGRPGRKPHYNGEEHKFTFPSGATLEFGHFQHEDKKHDYQGGSWAFVGADEATQFTGDMLAYPRTRQRRPVGSLLPIRWRGATNPGGIGHDYVKTRYVKTPEGRDPGTPDRQFFPATIADNPNLDRDDYVKQLRESGVDPLTLEQLLNGDWDAVAGGRFRRDWFGAFSRDPHGPDFVQLWRTDQAGRRSLVERFLWRNCTRFQTCDPAASASSAADYFVLSTWLVSPRSHLLWWGCERDRLELPEQVALCQTSYARHRPAFVCIEEVMNQRGLAQMLRRSKAPVMVVRGVTPGGRRKLEHALGAVVLASDGRLFLPEDDPAFPLDDVVGEVTRFTGDESLDANDDIVDTLSYAAEQLVFVGGGGGKGPGVWKPKGMR
jgi:phage terminase large subunit-like protein